MQARQTRRGGAHLGTAIAAAAFAAACWVGLPGPAWAQDPAQDEGAADAGADTAAPPADGHETTVEVVRESAPPGDETFPRRLMLRAAAVGNLPLVGPHAEIGNAGAGVRLAFGWYAWRRIALLAEIGAGQIPQANGDELSYTLVSASLAVRGTVVLDEALTIFGEAGAGTLVSTPEARAKVDLGGAEAMATLSASAGVEVDLFGFLSGEGGARFEVLFAERTWGGTSLVATPYVAATVHF